MQGATCQSIRGLSDAFGGRFELNFVGVNRKKLITPRDYKNRHSVQ